MNEMQAIKTPITKYVLVIHGGGHHSLKKNMTPAKEHIQMRLQALQASYAKIKQAKAVWMYLKQLFIF